MNRFIRKLMIFTDLLLIIAFLPSVALAENGTEKDSVCCAENPASVSSDGNVLDFSAELNYPNTAFYYNNVNGGTVSTSATGVLTLIYFVNPG